ncbi:MAG: threonine/serine dehydratase [Caldiserica bacterium]|jgi:threonine dehydratase|nr:threonine/serine dehydratase [Caldisericota bacterium]MDH7562362.1 threonine/serine dehydratase [Caldisericota bacterium]
MSEDAFSPFEVLLAREKIKNFVLKTPLIFSPSLSRLIGTPLFLKMECWQLTGSFKVRGAFNWVLNFLAKRGRGPLITASSGNHGIALAFAVSSLGEGLKVRVFSPEKAEVCKIGKMRDWGAEVVLGGRDFLEAYDLARKEAEETGASYVHSHAHPWTIAGQGTIGMEILEDLPSVQRIVVPIGGGGLISGISSIVKALNPRVEIIGVEPESAPGAFLSLRDGVPRERIDLKPTIADGLSGGFSPLPFKISRNLIDRVALVSEEEIIEAMRTLRREEQLIVEGAGAVTLAALMYNKVKPENRKTVLVLSGRNISSEKFDLAISGGRNELEG